MCEGGAAKGCKTDDEIRNWLRKKYVLLTYNQVRFGTEDFFEEARQPESRNVYVPISS